MDEAEAVLTDFIDWAQEHGYIDFKAGTLIQQYLQERVWTYEVRRYYANDPADELIAPGLTYAEAREICADPETSSTTCTKPENVARTQAKGPWFCGYNRE